MCDIKPKCRIVLVKTTLSLNLLLNFTTKRKKKYKKKKYLYWLIEYLCLREKTYFIRVRLSPNFLIEIDSQRKVGGWFCIVQSSIYPNIHLRLSEYLRRFIYFCSERIICICTITIPCCTLLSSKLISGWSWNIFCVPAPMIKLWLT